MEAEQLKIDFNKKQKMMIISIVAFICTLIGATYAWITNDLYESRYGMSITSAGLELTFRGTSEEIIADLVPGESVSKTFEVSNYGDSQSTYTLYWKTAENNLPNRNYFMYVLRDADTKEELITPRYLPSNVSNILTDMVIPGNTTQRYELVITYVKDPLYNQVENANQYFYGDISIRQASQYQRVIDVSSIYLDGVNIEYIPTLSENSIDTARTYCTDGSSVSVIDGDLVIQNQTSTTTCAIYFVSATPSPVNENIYNLLVVDPNGGTIEVDKASYFYKNEIIDLGVPLREGYAFTGWQVSGPGTSLSKNTKVTMGSTYSYAKATWVKGYWNKTVQTCAQNSPATYNKTYQTCTPVLSSCTKTSKSCKISTYKMTSQTCVWNGRYDIEKRNCSCTLSYSGTCYNNDYIGSTCSGCTGTCNCNQGTLAAVMCYCSKSTSCSGPTCPPGFPTGSCTTNYSNCSFGGTYWERNASSCSRNEIACNSTVHGQTRRICHKLYALESVANATITYPSNCANVPINCGKATENQENVTCEPVSYGFGSSSTTTESPVNNQCPANNTFDCTAATNGQTHVTYQNVYSYNFSEPNERVDTVCSPSTFACNASAANQEYTISCTAASTGYGFNPTVTQASYCFLEEAKICSDENNEGENYISACDLIEVP